MNYNSGEALNLPGPKHDYNNSIEIMASSNEGTPERLLQISPDTASKKGMLSDYFAQSDAKLDTMKKQQASASGNKFSVYMQTQRVVTGQNLRSS